MNPITCPRCGVAIANPFRDLIQGVDHCIHCAPAPTLDDYRDCTYRLDDDRPCGAPSVARMPGTNVFACDAHQTNRETQPVTAPGLHFDDGQAIYCEWTADGPAKNLIGACGAPATVDDAANDAWYCALHAPQPYRVTFHVSDGPGRPVGRDSLTVSATSIAHAERVARTQVDYPDHFVVSRVEVRLSHGA